MRGYGIQVYPFGVLVHTDGRWRRRGPSGALEVVPFDNGASSRSRQLRAFTEKSRRRLELIAANVAGAFRSLLTLTYHAKADAWEDDAGRNGRIAKRSKRDLNRFLSCLRRELGRYLWVQEFQERGVVHYHVLSERLVREERVALAWCRATEELDDAAALRYAVKVEAIESERKARGYLGRYVGKARQKLLPPGVEAAGRWWGRSRSLELKVLEEVISCEEGSAMTSPEGIRIVRCVRKYVSKVFKGKFRGGAFVDWGGELAARIQALVVRLRAFYGAPQGLEEMLAEHGWEVVKHGGEE